MDGQVAQDELASAEADCVAHDETACTRAMQLELGAIGALGGGPSCSRAHANVWEDRCCEDLDDGTALGGLRDETGLELERPAEFREDGRLVHVGGHDLSNGWYPLRGELRAVGRVRSIIHSPDHPP